MAKILLLEDDHEVAAVVVQKFKSRQNVVEWVTSGRQALDRLIACEYDLAIFDVIVEDLNGDEVCRRYREGGGKTPILMLTGQGSLPNKIAGFTAGADDYLVKPFAIEELLLRVQALLRRPHERQSDTLQVGELKLNVSECTVTRSGELIVLTPKEFMLLEFLMRNRDQVFSALNLLDKLWHTDSEASELAVRKCFSRLRNKIDGDNEPGYLVTIKGLGFKLSLPAR